MQESGRSSQPNLVSDVLNNHDGKPLSAADEDALIWAAGTMLGGALETVSLSPEYLIVDLFRSPECLGYAFLPDVHDLEPRCSEKSSSRNRLRHWPPQITLNL